MDINRLSSTKRRHSFSTKQQIIYALVLIAIAIGSVLYLSTPSLGFNVDDYWYNGSVMTIATSNVDAAADGWRSFESTDRDYNDSICIFISSFHRPINLNSSLPYYNTLDIVSQIVVAHGDELYYDDTIQSNKINHIKDWDNNEKWFTARRFITSAKYCVSSNILIVDDDILLGNEYLTKMYNAYKNDTQNFYGATPRICSNEGYIVRGVGPINYNVVLSNAIITSRHVIQTVADQFKNTTFLQRVIENKGNGEDLMWNYYFVHLYGKRPVLVMPTNRQDIKMLKQTPGFYTGSNNHRKMRSAICTDFFSTNRTFGQKLNSSTGGSLNAI